MLNRSKVIPLLVVIASIIVTPKITVYAESNNIVDYNSSCCQGLTGNTDCSESENPDITDICRIIDFLYLSHAPLCCPDETDTDGSGGDPDITDITKIIDFLYLSHAPLASCPATTVTDIDGNVYQTVTIGTQVWMAENLKVTHYRNGESIPIVTDADIWKDLTTGAYCEYGNDVNRVVTYGRLYNWYAVNDSRNIAPVGWHVPSDEEWQILVDYLGGDDIAGRKMKEVGTEHWMSINTATNESGFTALPAGSRGYNGVYLGICYNANFWSTTELFSYNAWLRTLYYNSSEVDHYYYDKVYGFSVRCVKD